MAIKSANETEGHLLKARDLDLMSPEEWQTYTAEVVEIRKMTYSYRRAMLANAKNASDNEPNDKRARGKSKRNAAKGRDA